MVKVAYGTSLQVVEWHAGGAMEVKPMPRKRRAHCIEFKHALAREALLLPPNNRIKPTCARYPGVEPCQLRKWIRAYEATLAANSASPAAAAAAAPYTPPTPAACGRGGLSAVGAVAVPLSSPAASFAQSAAAFALLEHACATAAQHTPPPTVAAVSFAAQQRAHVIGATQHAAAQMPAAAPAPAHNAMSSMLWQLASAAEESVHRQECEERRRQEAEYHHLRHGGAPAGGHYHPGAVEAPTSHSLAVTASVVKQAASVVATRIAAELAPRFADSISVQCAVPSGAENVPARYCHHAALLTAELSEAEKGGGAIVEPLVPRTWCSVQPL